MIDLREIYETIDEIQRNGTTVGQAEKLALLYIAADYMEREQMAENAKGNARRRYSQAAAPNRNADRVEVTPRSEFLEACNGAQIKDVLDVLDEHMEAIRVLYPREHKAVIERIKKTRTQ